MDGTYDPALVALSYGIAVLAAYAALTLASQIAHVRGRERTYWVVGGAIAMGAGIWSMHFVGMIAFQLPIATFYELPPTLLSLAIAVLVSGFALLTMNRAQLSGSRLLVSGCLMGIGITAMHYTGMSAMRMFPAIDYDASLVALSLTIAVAASVVAIGTGVRLRSADPKEVRRARIVSAFIMGGAIAGMHYAGMAAANFAPGSICVVGPQQISGFSLAAAVAACSVLCLCVAMLVGSTASRERRNARRSLGIRVKVAASYLVVSGLVAAFAVAALWVQLDAAARIAATEAEDVARVVVQTLGDDPLGNVDQLRRTIATLHLGRDDRDAFVVDTHRFVLADADPEEVGTVFPKNADDAVGQTLVDGRTRTFIERRGSPKSDAWQVVLPLYENTYAANAPIVGAIVLEYTHIYEALLADARAVAYWVGALGIACVLLTSLLGLRTASAVAKPLIEIENSARAIAAGQYEVRVPVRSSDELGALAAAFNQMGNDLGETNARLLEHQRHLEERVEQRTREWQQAEAAQRESVAEMRLITEHMPVALSYVDQDLRFRYHNGEFSRMFGVRDSEVEDFTVSSVLGPDVFATLEAFISQALSGVQVNYQWRQPGDTGRHFDTTLVPRRAENGNVIGYYAMTQDISERKRADAALRNSNEELKRSNVQLQEMRDQLVQSEKMASIGQLASGVAHEINNPIGFVQSNLGTLERYHKGIFAVLDCYREAENVITDVALQRQIDAAKRMADLDFVKEDVVALVAQSKDGISRVTKIVRDLKNFSRSANAEAWQFADLHQGLDSTLSIVSNEIKYKADVIKHYGVLPEIQCRPSQINQVFMNMLVNGAQAMKQHGVLTIRTGVHRDRAWVEFEDTGEGIKPEHLRRIFDPFFTTKPVGQGTGLGLSLSYGIIKDHGGEIEVRSIVGQGTTFRVSLPLRQAGSHSGKTPHTQVAPHDVDGDAELPSAQVEMSHP